MLIDYRLKRALSGVEPAEPDEYKDLDPGLRKLEKIVKENPPPPPPRPYADPSKVIVTIKENSQPLKGPEGEQRIENALKAHEELQNYLGNRYHQGRTFRKIEKEDYEKAKEIKKEAYMDPGPIGTLTRLVYYKYPYLKDNGEIGEYEAGILGFLKNVAEGVYTYLTQKPADNDLTDELHALKSLGLATMAVAPALTAIGTVAGGTAAAALGGNLALAGWYTADNIAGTSSLVKHQIDKEEKELKKKKEDLEHYYELGRAYQRGKLDEYEKSLKDKVDAGKATTFDYESFLKAKDELLNKQERIMNEYLEKKDKYDKDKAAYYEEQEKIKAAVDDMVTRTIGIRDLIDIIKTCIFNKEYDKALDNVKLAREALNNMANKFSENIELLKKSDRHSIFADNIKVLGNILDSYEAFLTGKNPTEHLVNAAVNNAKRSIKISKNNDDFKNRFPILDHEDPIDREIISLERKVVTSNYVGNQILLDLVNKFVTRFPFGIKGGSLFSPQETLAILNWIKKKYKPKCANIKNSKWIEADGMFYTDEMILYMIEDLLDAGISPEKIEIMGLSDMEAVARFRQYIWVAGKRGYFLPRELELYNRFKEITGLTDEIIINALKIEIPPG